MSIQPYKKPRLAPSPPRMAITSLPPSYGPPPSTRMIQSLASPGLTPEQLASIKANKEEALKRKARRDLEINSSTQICTPPACIHYSHGNIMKKGSNNHPTPSTVDKQQVGLLRTPLAILSPNARQPCFPIRINPTSAAELPATTLPIVHTPLTLNRSSTTAHQVREPQIHYARGHNSISIVKLGPALDESLSLGAPSSTTVSCGLAPCPPALEHHVPGDGVALKKDGETEAFLPRKNDLEPRSTVNGPSHAVSRHLSDLNAAQLEAASYSASSPLLILAGAGSGKTKTMMARIVNFIESGVSPAKILGLTFSTAATKEMRQRIKKVLPMTDAKQVTISTFHALALKICRENAGELGLPDDFSVLTGKRQRWVVHHGMDSLRSAMGADVGVIGEAAKAQTKKTLQEMVKAQAKGLRPDELGGEIGQILQYYEDAMAAGKTLDFPGIISAAAKLLKEKHAKGDLDSNWFSHILVDEFQDTTKGQFEFVDAVVGGGSVTVVGDDDQTIYAFQGSDHQNFNLFRTRYPGVHEVRLDENYRSTSVIVDAARALIEHNSERAAKNSKAAVNGGELIRIVEFRDEKCEVKWTCSEIASMQSHGGAEYKDFAILYRTKKVGKEVQEVLRRQAIPFNVHGVSFWRRKIVKHVVAALRLVRSKGDDEACKKLLKGFLFNDKDAKTAILGHIEKIITMGSDGGKGKVGRMWEIAKSTLTAKVSGALSKRHVALGRRMIACVESLTLNAKSSPSLVEFLESVIQSLPNAAHFENSVMDEDGVVLLNEFKENRTLRTLLLHKVSTLLSESFNTIPTDARAMGGLSMCEAQIRVFLDVQFVEEVKDNRIIREDNQNSVTLSTVHQSKGLEFPRVFIIRCMHGEMPLTISAHSNPSKSLLEEERRLLYVAMTRAKHSLTITFPSRLRGLPVNASPYIAELPSLLLRRMRIEEAPLPAGASGAHVSGVGAGEEGNGLDMCDAFFSCGFTKRFEEEERATISSLFHKWARQAAFNDVQKLIGKIKGVIADKSGSKTCRSKHTLQKLQKMLQNPDEGSENRPNASPTCYAKEILAFEAAPEHVKQAHRAATQRHFQKQASGMGMAKKDPTPKQIAFLKSLGCNASPKTMMEASALIEKFRKI